jgi:predicted DNA-binding transcriptional regulator YafY
MSKSAAPLKRQIEILGLCADRDRPLRHSELQDAFGRDKPTIDRDLRSLRSLGIDIHSTKKGVVIDSKIAGELLHELLRHYIGYNYSAVSYDRAIQSLVRTQKENALSIIVHLQQGIERGRMVMIDYEKEKGTVETGRVICPLLLFQSLSEWRVLAIHEGIRKQYILSKIRTIEPTAKTFKKPPIEESLEIFNASWNAWIGGGPKHTVRLQFSKELANKMAHRYFTETQEFTHNDDGTAVLAVQVNSLVEVAMWVVSNRGARALEPRELVDLILKLAEDAIKNHQSESVKST